MDSRWQAGIARSIDVVDAAEDRTPEKTTVDTPAGSWLDYRERLAELIHTLRVTAPLLHHRVQEDGGTGAIEL